MPNCQTRQMSDLLISSISLRFLWHLESILVRQLWHCLESGGTYFPPKASTWIWYSKQNNDDCEWGENGRWGCPGQSRSTDADRLVMESGSCLWPQDHGVMSSSRLIQSAISKQIHAHLHAHNVCSTHLLSICFSPFQAGIKLSELRALMELK